MKEFLKKAWAWMDGNKTIIGTGILLVLDQFGALVIPLPILTVVTWTVAALTGASLVHHAQKGYFTTNKGK